MLICMVKKVLEVDVVVVVVERMDIIMDTTMDKWHHKYQDVTK